MATRIVPEISRNNKYWISKHRHYELKHFCLQYPIWKAAHASCNDLSIPISRFEYIPTGNLPSDPTSKRLILREYYAEKIELVERTAKMTDKYLYDYILKAVTEGLSYSNLKSRLDIPCGRDMYYDRYRRFFWLLSNERD